MKAAGIRGESGIFSLFPFFPFITRLYDAEDFMQPWDRQLLIFDVLNRFQILAVPLISLFR